MKKIEFQSSPITLLNERETSLILANFMYIYFFLLHFLYMYFLMNVFPLIIPFAYCITSAYSLQRNSQPEEESPYLWSQCYDDLGCVNNTEEWYDSKLRPLKQQPLPRHIIKTTFILFNKKESDPRDTVNVEPLTPISEQIRATKFDNKKLKTHIIIHDFTSNGMAGWIKHAVKSLLAIDAGNIISVDWTGGAEPPYSIAVQNARLVALEVAALIEVILNEFVDMSSDNFYLIGQGLGAHIAGYVGQKINGIGRITGLDPVGLYFKDMPPSIRLDPQDAKFVDIINTDIEMNHGQGSGDPYGHFNFFPNGGLTQKGCNATSLYPNLNEISRDMLKEGDTAPGCNHKRAAKYFTASIDELNNECIPMGYTCSNYSAFKRAECLTDFKEGSTCSKMGYLADFIDNNYTEFSTRNFYLDTNDRQPFCMFAYKIIIALTKMDQDESIYSSENTTSMKTMSGMFCATVFSGDTEDIMFRTNLNHDGIGFQKLLSVDEDNVFLTYQKPPKIRKPEKIVLRFESENNETNAAYVRYVEISDLPDSGNSAFLRKFCGDKKITILKNRDAADFTYCDKTKLSAIINDNNKKYSSTVVDTVPALRRRRYYPINDKSLPFEQTLDVSEEYDESELPEPAEDDYYSNR